MQSWYLANADELAAEYKYTFYKPSEKVIQEIAIGEVVKLIFRFESDDPEAPAAERRCSTKGQVLPFAYRWNTPIAEIHLPHVSTIAIRV